ncbi:MAG TPA: CdaR family protein [Massilibacterium sp.]|nr:CdaR family protein [Massilibacterium sp.]
MKQTKVQHVGNGEEKEMDKLFKSPWFVKLTAFLLALMLYFVVTLDESTSPGGNPFRVGKESQEQFETKLNVYYDQNKFIISEVPKKITVTLKGSSSLIRKTQLNKDYEFFIDLQHLQSGEHKVPIKYKNISGKLDVKTEPVFIDVIIEEKITASFPIKIELMNTEKLPDGFATEKPIANPNHIKVTGTREQIEQIAYSKGYIDVEGKKETIQETIPINIYNKDGEIMDLVSDPAVVDVKVPITFPYKEVPVKLNREGEVKDGLSIVSITPEIDKVTVFGPQKVLESIEFIEGGPIDLSKIEEDTTIEVPLQLPKDATKVDPDKIKVHIDVEKESQITFTKVPIKIAGLSDGFKAFFIHPDNGKIEVVVKGAQPVLESIGQKDIEAYVDLTTLSGGDHDVKIEFNSPQNVKVTTEQKNVTVRIRD